MTAKEKAKELIGKYFIEINEIAENSISWRQGKKSALIAVDEIIKELESTKFNYGVEKLPFHYWQEVKKEIELL